MVAAGGRVIAHYGRDRAGAEAAVAGAAAGRAHLLRADLGQAPQVDALWEAAVEVAGGRIDVLVNNAAVMRQSGGIADPVEAWDRVWDEALAVNVLAPARLLRHAAGEEAGDAALRRAQLQVHHLVHHQAPVARQQLDGGAGEGPVLLHALPEDLGRDHQHPHIGQRRA